MSYSVGHSGKRSCSQKRSLSSVRYILTCYFRNEVAENDEWRLYEE